MRTWTRVTMKHKKRGRGKGAMLQSSGEGVRRVVSCQDTIGAGRSCLLWKKLGGVPLHCSRPDRDLPPEHCLGIFLPNRKTVPPNLWLQACPDASKHGRTIMHIHETNIKRRLEISQLGNSRLGSIDHFCSGSSLKSSPPFSGAEEPDDLFPASLLHCGALDSTQALRLVTWQVGPCFRCYRISHHIRSTWRWTRSGGALIWTTQQNKSRT